MLNSVNPSPPLPVPILPSLVNSIVSPSNPSQLSSTIDKTISYVNTELAQTNTNIAETNGAVLNRENTKWAERITLVGSIAGLIYTTVTTWTGSSTDVGQIVIITALGGKFVLSIYRQRQDHLEQKQNIKQEKLCDTRDTLSFLNESAMMADQCLNPPFDIAPTVAGFQKYIIDLPAGTVPNVLVAEWKQANTLAASGPNTPARQMLLSAHMEGTIEPLTRFYYQQEMATLNALGSQPPSYLIDAFQSPQTITLQTLQGTMVFLQESRDMAQKCLEGKLKSSPALTIAAFRKYMEYLPLNTVPQSLTTAWKEAETVGSSGTPWGRTKRLNATLSSTLLPLIDFCERTCSQQISDLESQAASVPAANENTDPEAGLNPQQAHGAAEEENEPGQAPAGATVVPLSSAPGEKDEEVVIIEE